MRSDDPYCLTPPGAPVFPNMGIEAGAKYVPPDRFPLQVWARKVGRSALQKLPAMTQNGLAYYYVASEMSIEMLACAAVQRLLESSSLRPEEVDVIIYCHTNNSSVMAAPASIPAAVAKRFGMQRALFYSVAQQTCASGIYALRLLRTLMWRHPSLKNALVISADKVFGERFRNVSTYAIQSDGAMALWVRRDAPRNQVGHISFHSEGAYYKGVDKGPELTRRFQLNYPLLAHRMINEVIRKSGWSLDQVDAVLPMNANLTAFSRVMDLLGLPREKLHSENIGEVGHMFCCDPFLNFLERFARHDRVLSGNGILFASSATGVFTALGLSRSWTGPVEQSPWIDQAINQPVDQKQPSPLQADTVVPEPLRMSNLHRASSSGVNP